MGEKKEIARLYISKGLKRDDVLLILGLSKHQYYYQRSYNRPGRKKSKNTKRLVDHEYEVVADKQVIEEIEQIKSDSLSNYGYRKMSYQLMLLGYFINHKKVYRLMRENNLLQTKRRSVSKNYVRYRSVIPNQPLEVLEMDIKFVWIEEYKRHAYVLNIIDTFSRYILHWQVGYQMKSEDVKKAWESVINNHLQEENTLERGLRIEVRNDNGPQFSSKMIRDFFKENYLHQVFTHPYTPQENGHVESFHKILSDALAGRLFWSLDDLEADLNHFYDKYNNFRLHSSIANLAPKVFWELWKKGVIERSVKMVIRCVLN